MTESLPRHTERRRKFISEAFHSFHQPLTGLHCGLELTLQKPRTEQEYRERIATALEYAGAVLQLNKAVRELVEAADPGERFGIVELGILLGQFRDQLQVVAKAAGVLVDLKCEGELWLGVDPAKLLRCLGSLASELIEDLEASGSVSVTAKEVQGSIVILFRSQGQRKERRADNGLNEKLRVIRRDAACSYIWTLGGDVAVKDDEFEVTLPAVLTR